MPEYFISRSQTRHIVGPPAGERFTGRVFSLCRFSVHPGDEDLPAEAIRDCGECQELLAAELARQAAAAAGAAEQTTTATAPGEPPLREEP